MWVIKKFILFVFSVFLFLIFGAIIIGMGHETSGSLIILGGFCYSVYRLFISSSPMEKSTPSTNQKFNNRTIQTSKAKERFGSDLSFKVTLNGRPADDYLFPEKELSQAKFLDHKSTIEIAGFHVRGPIYHGNMNNTEGSNDPSVIDTSLPVRKHGPIDPLGYWPSYKDCSPEQRWQYLEWLTKGRGEIHELGYVFIYFYGIERYIFKDATTDSDTIKDLRLRFIVKELRRLQKIFSTNRSFQGYSNNLLDVIFIKFFPDRLDVRKSSFPGKDTLAAKYIIAKHANEGIDQSLDSDWALHWLFASGELKRTRTAREQYQLIRLVYKNLYDSSDGIKVPTNKTRLSLNYQPASSNLNIDCGLDVPSHWCDPMVLKRPVKELAKISKNLMPIVRKVAKAIASGNLLDILASWPLDLKIDPPKKLAKLIANINSFCEKHTSPTLSSLGRLFGIELSEKVSKSQLSKFADALSACGWVIVPDPHVTVTSLSKSDHVFLYQGIRPDKLSPAGKLLDIKVRLAALLAQADDEIHEQEVNYINGIVDEHADSVERDYLLGYALWRLSSKTSAAGLKAQIDSLKITDRDDLARVLVRVAHADGCFPKDEIRELEKLFAKIGLDKSHVAKLLHESAPAPVDKSQNRKRLPVHKSPNINLAANTRVETVTLDLEILKAHNKSTKEIQSVLSQIFDEIEPEEETDDSASLAIQTDVWHNGALDDKHHILMEWLVTQEEWARSDVEAKCKKIGLMIDGALESINETAFDLLGDSLVEIDDPVVIYRDVLPA